MEMHKDELLEYKRSVDASKSTKSKKNRQSHVRSPRGYPAAEEIRSTSDPAAVDILLDDVDTHGQWTSHRFAAAQPTKHQVSLASPRVQVVEPQVEAPPKKAPTATLRVPQLNFARIAAGFTAAAPPPAAGSDAAATRSTASFQKANHRNQRLASFLRRNK